MNTAEPSHVVVEMVLLILAFACVVESFSPPPPTVTRVDVPGGAVVVQCHDTVVVWINESTASR